MALDCAFLDFMFRKGEKELEEPGLQVIPASWPQMTKRNNGRAHSRLCLSGLLPLLRVLTFFFFYHYCPQKVPF